MLKIGYTLSSEEHDPKTLIKNAQLAEEAGFEFASISDHFHPWIDAQGQSPFVWAVLGGISEVTQKIQIMTGVTCPIIRIHPVIIAQAAATAQVMLNGRFSLGVGTGENLNEHITGFGWPPIRVRQEMLAEAIYILRLLWKGGYQHHYGKFFNVDGARIYTNPEQTIPIYVAASGKFSAILAGQQGDGLISTSPKNEITDIFEQFGGEGKPKYAQFHVCFDKDAKKAKEMITKIWPNSALPDPLNVELRLPKDYMSAASSLSPDQITANIPLGQDVEKILESINTYTQAGFDHIYIHNIGPNQAEFIKFFTHKIIPKISYIEVPQKEKIPHEPIMDDKQGIPLEGHKTYVYAHTLKKP